MTKLFPTCLLPLKDEKASRDRLAIEFSAQHLVLEINHTGAFDMVLFFQAYTYVKALPNHLELLFYKVRHRYG